MVSMVQPAPDEISSCNLLVSSSSRAPRRARREIVARLRELGDEAPLVIPTDRKGLIAVRAHVDPRAVIRGLRARHEISPGAFRSTSKWVPVDLWAAPDLESLRAAVVRLRDRIMPDERWRLTVERRSTGCPPLAEIIDALAALVDAPVDLSHPEKILLVELFAGGAALAVVTPAESLSLFAPAALAGAAAPRRSAASEEVMEQAVEIPAGAVTLHGDLAIPEGSRGIVLFAHGSGSSRMSPRNRYVAGVLRDSGLATLLMDLLTLDEESIDVRTGHLRFDIAFLAGRLVAATDWLTSGAATRHLAVGYFGASTGAGAALVAAAQRPDVVRTIVSRGGRPDLAGAALGSVKAPTLLIVGGHDHPVIGMNREAMAKMRTEVKLEIVPGASHLFEEPGTLEVVARLARDWFAHHLQQVRPAA